jgi:uncharacterized membrane protein YjgN (DUF898 family)
MSEVRHAVTFTGHAETYHPVWRRNMLLLLLSGGFAFPFTMVNRLRYYYRHTEVAGSTLDYHANPWLMLGGNLGFTALLNAVYYGLSFTGQYQSWGIAAVQLLIAAALPVGLHGFLEFQLAHTSWRGQRMHLAAKPMQAFKAMGLPTLFYMAGGALGAWAVVAGMDGHRLLSYELGAAAALCWCFGLPWVYVQYKRYQNRYATLGSWRNQNAPEPGFGAQSLGLALKTGAMALLAMAFVVLPVAWGLSELLGLDWPAVARMRSPVHANEGILLALVLTPAIYVLIAAVMAMPYPYLSARMQNELWANAAHDEIRFECNVPVDELLKLTRRHWLLIALTLGWYYPKAAMAEARLRLQSVAVWVGHEPISQR